MTSPIYTPFFHLLAYLVTKSPTLTYLFIHHAITITYIYYIRATVPSSQLIYQLLQLHLTTFIYFTHHHLSIIFLIYLSQHNLIDHT